MSRTRALSPIARHVLAILRDARDDWSYGYDLCRKADVKSGTLYPLLIRLEVQGYLEAKWQPPAQQGRPPRHAYRLTSAGILFARENPTTSLSRGRDILPEKPA